MEKNNDNGKETVLGTEFLKRLERFLYETGQPGLMVGAGDYLVAEFRRKFKQYNKE